MKRIHLIRHGQTAWNADGRWQGMIDIPLSETGLNQAAALASYMSSRPLSSVYSSDLQRAVQTAEPLAKIHDLPLNQDARLREQNLGIFQGLTHEQHREKYPELVEAMYRDYWGFTFPEGENRGQVRDRALAFWKEMIEQDSQGETAVVLHGGTIRVLLMQLLGPSRELDHLKLLNTSITTLGWEKEKIQLIELAQIPHLQQTPQSTDAL
ncbi:MAG: phosphoglycerate mutase [Chloroflexi bacterium OLB15]|nr:MAG: phosphoglycerate mutase [Chloroflexi bacterium OLB15]